MDHLPILDCLQQITHTCTKLKMGLRWYGIDLQKSIYMQTYFGLQQRYNSNMSIISPVDLFVKIILFWSYFFIRQKKRYGTLISGDIIGVRFVRLNRSFQTRPAFRPVLATYIVRLFYFR